MRPMEKPRGPSKPRGPTLPPEKRYELDPGWNGNSYIKEHFPVGTSSRRKRCRTCAGRGLVAHRSVWRGRMGASKRRVGIQGVAIVCETCEGAGTVARGIQT